MNWIAWATLGYFMNAIAIAVDKALLVRRELGNPAVYTIFISTLGLLVLGLAPWGWQRPSLMALGYGLASGALFTLGLWALFTVLKFSEASRVPAFIGSLSPLFVFAGSRILLDEHLSSWALLAFGLLVVGGFIMVGGHGGLPPHGILLGLLSSALFGLSFVLIKLTFQETNFISGLIITRLGSFATSLGLLVVPGTLQRLRASAQGSAAGVRWAFLSGQTVGALAGLLNSYAIKLGSVTFVNALQGVQYVFLLGLAVGVSRWAPQLFRDEFNGRVTFRKIIGTSAIGAGLWLLAVTI